MNAPMNAPMNAKSLFGLVALLPAAFGPVTGLASPLVAFLCSGDGHSRSITLPLKPALPGNSDLCCAKGCHAGSSKKRNLATNAGDD